MYDREKIMKHLLLMYFSGLGKEIASGNSLGIWDGESMLMKTCGYKYVGMAQLLWRYGMDIYNIRNWINTNLMNDFMK